MRVTVIYTLSGLQRENRKRGYPREVGGSAENFWTMKARNFLQYPKEAESDDR